MEHSSSNCLEHPDQPFCFGIEGCERCLFHFYETDSALSTGKLLSSTFAARYRNMTICLRVQVPLEPNRPLPTPVVMPFSTAQPPALSQYALWDTSVIFPGFSAKSRPFARHRNTAAWSIAAVVIFRLYRGSRKGTPHKRIVWENFFCFFA